MGLWVMFEREKGERKAQNDDEVLFLVGVHSLSV